MKRCDAICFLLVFSTNCSEKPHNNIHDGKKYEENKTAQYYFGKYVLSQIKFNENDTVLDVGCGNGETTYKITKKVPNGFVVGIDNDRNILSQAKQHYQNISNVKFNTIDATVFECNQQINKVVAICSLSWISNQNAVYKRVSEALALNGEFIALVSDANDPLFISHNKTIKKPQWKKYFKDYTLPFYPSTREQIKTYLANAQLRLESICTVKLGFMTISKQAFLEKLNTNPGLKDVIPPNLYPTFLQDVAEKYIMQTKPIDENNIKIGYQLLFFIAKKK